jgi:RimJ/RimL family protein N-acetyltransferase
MKVRPVQEAEGARLRELRLASLAADPDAFGATYERDAARPAAFWDDAAAASAAGGSQRTFVGTDDDDDQWLGLALVHRDDERPDEAVVNAMWVAPAARGRGLGHALCEACLAWAAERGLPRVRIHVFAGNGAARAMYEAVGFTPCGPGTPIAEGRVVHELVRDAPGGG